MISHFVGDSYYKMKETTFQLHCFEHKKYIKLVNINSLKKDYGNFI